MPGAGGRGNGDRFLVIRLTSFGNLMYSRVIIANNIVLYI